MLQTCGSCGASIRENAKFCTACGARATLTTPAVETDAPAILPQSVPNFSPCPACSSDDNLNARFCRHCGSAMDGSQPSGTGAASLFETTLNSAEDDDWSDGSPFWKRTWFIAALLAVIVAGCGGAWYVLKQPAMLSCISRDASSRPECALAAKAAVNGESQEMFIVADANIRNQATASGSNVITKLLRGTRVNGVMQMGADGESRWLKLSDGRGYIGMVNLASAEPPKLATLFNSLEWTAPHDMQLLATPNENAPIIETLASGSRTALAGLTENGFVEIKRPKGGVGYAKADGLNLSAAGFENGSGPASQTMNSDGFYGEFVGLIEDQDVTIGFNVDSFTPKLPSAAYANYANRVTRKSCHSLLQLVSKSATGDYVFRQAPRAGYPGCGSLPTVSMKIAPGGYNAANISRISVFWADSSTGRRLMSGDLDQMGD